jgi:hypothetical protein
LPSPRRQAAGGLIYSTYNSSASFLGGSKIRRRNGNRLTLWSQ